MREETGVQKKAGRGEAGVRKGGGETDQEDARRPKRCSAGEGRLE